MSLRLQTWLFAACLAGFTLAANAGELTVSAAASLTNAFKALAQTYETQHPGTRVQLNFGASGALLQQLAKGAPVDVFASADQETMDQAQKQGLTVAALRQDFARNTLVLIVPADSRLALQKLADLGQADVRHVALGNPSSVPVGRYGKQALEAAQLWPRVASKVVHAQSVRQALDYVARGEADAGFVYATDASLMPNKVRVAFAVPLEVSIRYPIAPVAASTQAAEAARFTAFVLAPAGQALLARHGFLKP